MRVKSCGVNPFLCYSWNKRIITLMLKVTPEKITTYCIAQLITHTQGLWVMICYYCVCYFLKEHNCLPSVSVVQNLPIMQESQENQVQSLGWENALVEDTATHSVFLPGESHGQRSLAGYSPWGHKQLDTAEDTQLIPTKENKPSITKIMTTRKQIIFPVRNIQKKYILFKNPLNCVLYYYFKMYFYEFILVCVESVVVYRLSCPMPCGILVP